MRFPTGLAAFDVSTCGGFPAGVVEVSGPDSSGKTAMSLSCAREAGMAGLPCALISMQGSPDTQFIRTAGHPDVLVVQCTTGESALHAVHTCLNRGVKVVILDSIANVRPGREDDMPMGEWDTAAPRMLFHGLHLIQREAWRRDSLVLLTNEIRAQQGRGRQTIPAHDRVLEDVTDMRIRLARQETHMQFGEVDWVEVGLHVTRTATSLPGFRTTFRLCGSTGVDRNRELLEALVDNGTFVRTGTYWKGLGDMLGPGYAKASQQIGQRYQHYREALNGDGD